MTIYQLIADQRREHPTPDASRTLDLVVTGLGKSRDNLRAALAALEGNPLPPGGKEILDELLERATQYGIDDLEYAPAAVLGEPDQLDAGSFGIVVLLGVSSLLVVGLAVVAVVAGLNMIFHFY